jgi:hypothetical protein
MQLSQQGYTLLVPFHPLFPAGDRANSESSSHMGLFVLIFRGHMHGEVMG